MAKPNLASDSVERLVAEHVEEQAIDGVLVQGFREDFHRLVAVVASVDAGRVETVIDYRLSAGLPEKPLRMGIENRLRCLAEVKPSDDADLAGMRFSHDIAEHVLAGRQVRTCVVKPDRRGIVRRD